MPAVTSPDNQEGVVEEDQEGIIEEDEGIIVPTVIADIPI